jgi:hypothetical protein
MTFEQFGKDLVAFLTESTVNLGRKTTKTRQVFLSTIQGKLDSFLSEQGEPEAPELPKISVEKDYKPKNPMDDRLVCLKPKNPRRALDVGKGVTAMTPGESMRADEETGGSPFSKGNTDE